MLGNLACTSLVNGLLPGLVTRHKGRLAFTHKLQTPGEEIAFIALPKIHSHSQIFKYIRPKHILSATLAQNFRFLWFMLSLGVRGKNCKVIGRPVKWIRIVVFQLDSSCNLIHNNILFFPVTQECTPNEMIFTIRTNEGFNGRIYTFKHFDRSPCFVRGNGGKNHRLVSRLHKQV